MIFTFNEIKEKHEKETKLLQWIADNEGEKVCKYYGLDPLPEDQLRWHKADYKCQHQISESGITLLMYVLIFEIKRDRIFHTSIAQIKTGLEAHFNISFSRSKIHRVIKELEEKEALETIAQTQKGTFYIFKLTE